MSIAKKFEDLLNPKPIPDVLDDIGDLTRARYADSDEHDSETEPTATGNSRLRLQNLTLLEQEDDRYKGEKISRKTIGGESDDDIDWDGAEIDSGNQSEGDESEDEDLDQEHSEERQESSSDNDQSDIDDLHLGLKKEKVTDTELVLTSAASANDVEKGKAVKQQLELWDSLMEVRINMQSCLNKTNRLPPNSEWKRFLQSVNQDKRNIIAQSQSSVHRLTTALTELRSLILEHNSSTSESIAENSGAKSVEEELRMGHDLFKPSRNSTLNRWHDRTRLSSGKLFSKSNSNFSAMELSPVSLVEQIMSDKRRLIDRTRVARSTYIKLGCGQPNPSEKPANLESDSIFDDDDFYHSMLKELIERKSSGDMAKQWANIQQQRTKLKKSGLDCRATKGRRLRYDVHPKLVNFMAPVVHEVESERWTEKATNDLFSSLFTRS